MRKASWKQERRKKVGRKEEKAAERKPKEAERREEGSWQKEEKKTERKDAGCAALEPSLLPC